MKNLLLYTDEHLKCFNYCEETKPVVRFIDFKKDRTVEGEMPLYRIAFITSGKVKHSLNHEKPNPIKGGYMLFVPANTHLSITAVEDSTVVVFYLENILDICECFDDEQDKLFADDMLKIPVGIMEIHPRILFFLDTFGVYFNDGMRCQFYLRTKIKEMFYYFRNYYEKTRIKIFFGRIKKEDREFSEKIYSNWRKFKTTKELADFMNSSRSAFDRKFESVFGEKPNEWLKNKRRAAIWEDLTYTDMPFKELADKHLFATQGHFSDYCKNNFEKSPSEIRESKGRMNYL